MRSAAGFKAWSFRGMVPTLMFIGAVQNPGLLARLAVETNMGLCQVLDSDRTAAISDLDQFGPTVLPRRLCGAVVLVEAKRIGTGLHRTIALQWSEQATIATSWLLPQ